MRKLVFDKNNQIAILRLASYVIWGSDSLKQFDPTNSKALAVMDDSSIIAVIVYYNYDPDAKNIQLSFASINKSWLTRKILNEILHYPFDELNLNNVYVTFASDNLIIYDLVKKLNADCYILPEMENAGKDKVVAILKKDKWKLHRLYHERTKSTITTRS